MQITALNQLEQFRTLPAGNPVLGLFAGGANGFWLDASDRSTLFQDSAGTTPVTALGDPVGRWLDKSGRGNHFVQTGSGARPVWGSWPLSAAIAGRVRNLLGATTTLATQSRTVTAVSHTLSFKGTGTVTLSGASTAGPLVGTGVNDRVSLVFTPSAASLTLTVSGTVTDAQLEIGALTAYQRVGVSSRYDVSEAGQPQVYFVSPNGLNDFMVSAANVVLTGTNKVAVIGGFTKKSDSAIGQLVELSVSVSANNGTFSMPTATAGGSYGAGLKGTSPVVVTTATGFAAPTTNVVSAIHDLALTTDETLLRVNGVQVATSGATDAGGGNFGSYLMYIGARAGTSLFSSANIYQLIAVGKTPTTSELNQTETFVAAKTKGSLA
jgi:hypothetical protein